MPLFPGAPGDCIMLRPLFFRRSCESRNLCPQRFRFLPAQERRISVNITSHGLIQRFLRFLPAQERRIAFNPSAIALRVQGNRVLVAGAGQPQGLPLQVGYGWIAMNFCESRKDGLKRNCLGIHFPWFAVSGVPFAGYFPCAIICAPSAGDMW